MDQDNAEVFKRRNTRGTGPVHEFYRLKALITLEQVNTTSVVKKKNVDGDRLGWLGKQQQANQYIYLIFIWLVMSLWFFFGDNYWNDAHPPSW